MTLDLDLNLDLENLEIDLVKDAGLDGTEEDLDDCTHCPMVVNWAPSACKVLLLVIYFSDLYIYIYIIYMYNVHLEI